MSSSVTDPSRVHHVFLVPGLFGFGLLAGYDYFEHLERALAERFDAAGVGLRMTVVSTPPTASMPVRAAMVAQSVFQTTADDASPIHLLGHSTGGLDARLVLCPSVRLAVSEAELAWRSRVRSVVTINTPHFGTPLAGYFTTAAGTRVLYLMSLLTVASLGVGRLPLSAVAAWLRVLSGIDTRLGFELKILDDMTGQALRFVGEQGREEIGRYLNELTHDQAGIMQLMPEVMELFNAVVTNSPAVRYGSVATASPLPGPRRIVAALGRPIGALHLAAYTLLYGFASRAASRYPYALPDAPQQAMLAAGLAGDVVASTVDGVVPTLSMLWGELLWCGAADHLDVVGHFGDRGQKPRVHVDWLRSGAHFGRREFAAMMDAIAAFLLREPGGPAV